MGRTNCHVAMKLHLYGDKETQKEIADMLTSQKDIFFSKVSAQALVSTLSSVPCGDRNRGCAE